MPLRMQKQYKQKPLPLWGLYSVGVEKKDKMHIQNVIVMRVSEKNKTGKGDKEYVEVKLEF